jgi:hypothetical protein
MPSLKKRLHAAGCRFLSDRLLTVTGCQRSGTTLVFMMLAAHPAVRGYDESEIRFRFPPLRVLLKSRLAGRHTCVKHPMATAYGDVAVRDFPHAVNVFAIRHPCSVVSSMRKLVFKDGESWLRKYARDELTRHRTTFEAIAALDVASLSDVEAGAWVWAYKIRTADVFRQRGLDVHAIRYEDLLDDPRTQLSPVLEAVGLPWSPALLEHERFQSRAKFAGENRADRPLDSKRRNPEWALSHVEIRQIEEICAEGMSRLGYA